MLSKLFNTKNSSSSNLNINKNDLNEFFNYLNNELPKLFHLEIVNVVCTKRN